MVGLVQEGFRPEILAGRTNDLNGMTAKQGLNVIPGVGNQSSIRRRENIRCTRSTGVHSNRFRLRESIYPRRIIIISILI